MMISGSFPMRLNSDFGRRRGFMLTAGLNALALMRFGGFRLAHGGGNGFAWLVIGLVAIGVAVWAVSRPEKSETVKN